MPPLYARLAPSGNGGFRYTLDGGVEGLLDAQGRPVGPAAFRDLRDFSDGLAAAEAAGGSSLSGYVDTRGKWVIKPQFSVALPFRQGLALVMLSSSGGNVVHWRFIRPDGRFAFAPTFSDASSFQDGLAMAALSEEKGQGVINQAGQWVVPPRPGQQASIKERSAVQQETEPQGEPLIVLRTAQGQQLLSADGKLLYSAKGEQTSITPAGQQRAFVSIGEAKQFLLDTQSRRIFQAAQPEWLSQSDFAQGLARASRMHGDGLGFIDRQGRWALPPSWRWGSDFDEGLAVMAELGSPAGSGGVGVIDRKGRWVLGPSWGRIRTRLDGAVNGESQLPRRVFEAFPVEPARALPAPRDAAQAQQRASAPVAQWFLRRSYFHAARPGAGLRELGSVLEHPCGFEQFVLPGGQAPAMPEALGLCLLAARLGDEAVAALPAPLAQALAAARQAEAIKRVAWLRTVAKRDGAQGGVKSIVMRQLHPALAQRQMQIETLMEQASWITGPADVLLNEALGIRFKLPAGLQLLRPVDARQLKEGIREVQSQPLPEPAALGALDEALAAGDISAAEHAKRREAVLKWFPSAAASAASQSADDAQFARQLEAMDFGLIRPLEGGWQARLSVQATGAQALSATAFGDPEELLKTLRVYQDSRGSGWGFVPSGAGGYTLYNWVLKPAVDVKRAEVEFAYRHDNLAGRALTYNALSFGRAHAVVLQASLDGPFLDELAMVYLPDLRQLVKQVEFPSGQRHADIQDGDQRSQLRLAQLVTGTTPPALKQLGRAIQRMEAQHQERANNALWKMLGVFLVVCLLVAGARQGGKRADGPGGAGGS